MSWVPIVVVAEILVSLIIAVELVIIGVIVQYVGVVCERPSRVPCTVWLNFAIWTQKDSRIICLYDIYVLKLTICYISHSSHFKEQTSTL